MPFLVLALAFVPAVIAMFVVTVNATMAPVISEPHQGRKADHDLR